MKSTRSGSSRRDQRDRPRALLSPLMLASAVVFALAASPPQRSARAQRELQVVTTLPTYGAIAREITGELARVESIARGDVDPHFVNPRPSYAAMIQRADLLVTTGLDLELWVPALLDRASNARVVEGADGHVTAYAGIELLQVPRNPSRAGGDIHVFGNPHVHTDPVNAILIARNILQGLRRVDPDNAPAYEANASDFQDRILRRTFGDELVDLLGSETLFDLARGGGFWEFVEDRNYEGEPLVNRLGGWLEEAAPFRGRQVVCYHKNWAYFSERFRLPCVEYVESKPGIPPSPGHVRKIVDLIRSEEIPVLLAANYFNTSRVERVARRSGARAVIVPEHVGGAEGVDSYFDLVDLWVDRLSRAFRDASDDR